MEVFFEVLKYTLPSVVVFLTVYFLLRQYFNLERLKFQSDRFAKTQKDSLPVRLQAYERLSLFLERIRLSNLIIRFPHLKDTSAISWYQSMMMAVHQEYEHNMAMQLYVSDKLWEIVQFAKNETLNALTDAISQNALSDVATANLMQLETTLLADKAVNTALSAIRKEIQIYL
ncbi:MAG: hypothetical protein IPM48_12670 [Saprospiraceae bacterium]|nr:hypothetical protein [Saprospiraceae bacterium]